VFDVAWSDARDYARWLGAMTGRSCRLPSEAEWEYACRAGTTTKYALPAPEGSDDIAGKGFAHCVDCGSKWNLEKTAPVGQFPPNAWDLYDMHGNVWEWVEDCWHANYEVAPPNGLAWRETNDGDCSSRVLRGGSWNYFLDSARCASRYRLNPTDRYYSVGFRVVCSSPSSDP
jgi:formylglycine-generating enzyme required for sulfatase activity